MKKIISYSLWGDNPKYTQGAVENIATQKQFFPDWICRFYIHRSTPSYIFHRLKNDGAEVIDVDEEIGEGINKVRDFLKTNGFKYYKRLGIDDVFVNLS